MALETLKGIRNVGNYKVVDMDKLREKYPDKFNESGAMDWKWFEKDIRPNAFIYLRHDKNSVSFTLQKGSIKENGVNGCQVDQLIFVAKMIIEKLNVKFPCEENRKVINHLFEACRWLAIRKQDRKFRGVEGRSLK